ncbi:MAG: ribosome assembly factor SBDS, partial [Methanobacteriaceae archaeon]
MVNVDDAVIAKLESFGEKFEILVDADLAAEFKNPENSKVIIEDILAIEEIFKDAKKGDKASEESMEKIFETTDPQEVATAIIQKGTIQLTAQQKRDMQSDKYNKVVDKIAREAINPQTGLPHPPQRIRNAMEESKVRIDAFKSVDEQVKIALKGIKVKIPIKFEKVRLAVKLPGNVAGSAFTQISRFGVILNEEWQQDGSWVGIVEMSGGLSEKFTLKMNELAGGNAET